MRTSPDASPGSHSEREFYGDFSAGCGPSRRTTRTSGAAGKDAPADTTSGAGSASRATAGRSRPHTGCSSAVRRAGSRSTIAVAALNPPRPASNSAAPLSASACGSVPTAHADDRTPSSRSAPALEGQAAGRPVEEGPCASRLRRFRFAEPEHRESGRDPADDRHRSAVDVGITPVSAATSTHSAIIPSGQVTRLWSNRASCAARSRAPCRPSARNPSRVGVGRQG